MGQIVYLGKIPLIRYKRSTGFDVKDITVYKGSTGGYVLDFKDITGVIKKRPQNMVDFLAALSSSMGWSTVGQQLTPVQGTVNYIRPVPLQVAIAYWNYWAGKGNRLASTVLQALATCYPVP